MVEDSRHQVVISEPHPAGLQLDRPAGRKAVQAAPFHAGMERAQQEQRQSRPTPPRQGQRPLRSQDGQHASDLLQGQVNRAGAGHQGVAEMIDGRRVVAAADLEVIALVLGPVALQAAAVEDVQRRRPAAQGRRRLQPGAGPGRTTSGLVNNQQGRPGRPASGSQPEGHPVAGGQPGRPPIYRRAGPGGRTAGPGSPFQERHGPERRRPAGKRTGPFGRLPAGAADQSVIPEVQAVLGGPEFRPKVLQSGPDRFQLRRPAAGQVAAEPVQNQFAGRPVQVMHQAGRGDFQLFGKAEFAVDRFQPPVDINLVRVAVFGDDPHRPGREEGHQFALVETAFPAMPEDLVHVPHHQVLEGAAPAGGGLHGNGRPNPGVGQRQEGLDSAAGLSGETDPLRIDLRPAGDEGDRARVVPHQVMGQLASGQHGDGGQFLVLVARRPVLRVGTGQEDLAARTLADRIEGQHVEAVLSRVQAQFQVGEIEGGALDVSGGHHKGRTGAGTGAGPEGEAGNPVTGFRFQENLPDLDPGEGEASQFPERHRGRRVGPGAEDFFEDPVQFGLDGGQVRPAADPLQAAVGPEPAGAADGLQPQVRQRFPLRPGPFFLHQRWPPLKSDFIF
ncbi:MAG: hypothetical protein BWY73_00740 [candidate division TA06 bacterium ADurb.Bin417]|uniref:Uncharacterized protein n=1 Tax=candidate division TA06 bacterium ADurb.Bin417 TaxID=1852828 RepID=A0A1V5MH86_UNCT6|nr:MAG: hypothetical protein BWY73_00740 [candidate division TA06 bacterium ADurb.Bin417]